MREFNQTEDSQKLGLAQMLTVFEEVFGVNKLLLSSDKMFEDQENMRSYHVYNDLMKRKPNTDMTPAYDLKAIHVAMTGIKKFANAIHKKYPGKLLAYNCSPSFNWKKHLSDSEIATFQQKISDIGYKFQFITLAGFHTQNIAIFELAQKYKNEGMTAYSKIQEQEFAREKDGYTSVKHQREVGTSYFDAVSNTISSGKSSTTAMEGSTESEQF